MPPASSPRKTLKSPAPSESPAVFPKIVFDVPVSLLDSENLEFASSIIKFLVTLDLASFNCLNLN